MESEGRHHGLYARLAARHAPMPEVHARVEEPAAAEAAIIRRGDPFVRLHS